MFSETPYENPFLSVEKKMQEILGESANKKEKVTGDSDEGEVEEYTTYVDCFVKEKPQLKGYIKDLLSFAAQ
jgi:hypothetical protein